VSEFFNRFERTAWRLETRPFYAPDAEEFRRAQAGQPPTAAQRAQRQQWVEAITAATTAGRQVGRVLVVSFPLSPYWRWRTETPSSHIAAGENIRLVDRQGHPALADLTEDFWLFDNARVLALDFDPAGAFLGAHNVTDPRLTDRYHQQLALARSWSVPLVPGTVPAAR
jgi:hypothetical protein